MAILEGESMGGAIVTYISESDYYSPYFSGCLAVGAALLTEGDHEEPITFNYSPKIPILYLMNVDELNTIETYIEKSFNNHFHALWVDLRPGHCNVNYIERKNALDSLLLWIKEIKNLTPSSEEAPIRTSWGELKDCTVNLELGPSEVVFDGNGLWAVAVSHDAWGDVDTNIQSSDMTKLGIDEGMTFRIVLGSNMYDDSLQDKPELKFKFGSNSYLSVEQGELFALDHAQGFIRLSANGYAHPHRLNIDYNITDGDNIYIRKPVGVGAPLLGIPGGIDKYK